ncbi:MAG: hypothetical protein ACFB5Z_11850 [Elainellaceae cyanobacterium]
MNLEREIGGFTGFTVVWGLLALLVFGTLNLLEVPTGNFLNWLTAAAIFWWLIVITTVPWNIYFSARAVLTEAEISRQAGIEVDERACSYVNKVQNRVLIVAIGLHLISAIALYLLAATGVSAVGYLSSIAALLLTGLRPAIASYQYLAQRLANIGKALKYPREDVVTLKAAVEQLSSEQKKIALQLDPNDDSSWVAQQQRSLERLQQDVAQVAAAHEQLKAANAQDHARISLETRSAIAQLNEDSQFLDRVREIIRFFKAA